EAAGPDGVADALVDAVLEGDVVVEADAGQAADLDAVDDVIGAAEDLAALGRALDLPVGLSEGGDQLLDQPVHGGQPGAVDVHQGDGAALQPGNAQDVVDEAGGEAAAGAHHRDLDGAADRAGEAFLAGVLGVGGAGVRSGFRFHEGAM